MSGVEMFRLALGGLLLLCATAHAIDNGQWRDVPETLRKWFKSVRSPNGVPCCDIADGHRTTWDWKQDEEGGHFWVPIAGNMQQVPREAIVYNAGNPFDEAVVWYVRQGPDVYHIRCFVPTGGV